MYLPTRSIFYISHFEIYKICLCHAAFLTWNNKASKSPLDELKALKDLKDLKDFKEAVTNGKPTNLLKSGPNLLLFYFINRSKVFKA